MHIPLFNWLKSYKLKHLISDFIAAVVTTFVALPQSMAYAQLAGLPPELGLYSAVLPLLIYACIGSSRTLVIGPAALISLLISSSIIELAPQSPKEYLMLSVNLALLSGICLLILWGLKLGNFANMISKPVINGFTSASAFIIVVSQLPLVLDINLTKDLSFRHSIDLLHNEISLINPFIVAIGLGSIMVIWLANQCLPWLTQRLKLQNFVSQLIVKSIPVMVLILSIVIVKQFSLDSQYGVSVVGNIPNSLPIVSIKLIDFSLWPALALPASSIALLCFISTITTGIAIASKSQDKVSPNQELLALGAANIGTALTGCFSIAASLSRSMVNYTAGAVSQVSNVISAGFIILSIVFFTPYLSSLPTAVLGAIVIVSIMPMLMMANIKQGWQFNKGDTISMLFTFFATLSLGPDKGIWAGIACSIILLVHRSSKPHIAEVGRAPNGYFRNLKRLDVKQVEEVIFLRIDENLFFANIQYIENFIFTSCNNKPKIKHLVLIFSSVSTVDETALGSIKNWIINLNHMGITLHLSNIKGFLLDDLKKTDLLEKLQPGQVFYTADDAMKALEQDD